ncbi:hypothetical protein AK812_SmicGene20782 [Symbiodinium microadriaticum]|uniref:Uncharacterized protein n=1 Tax=Symbiodinium microadriaticum TaxID=2951 RepID=A0A1Q9DP46_SYMMI|nr:hypothetical protein AK812_SmicGene20782 [Symbiodinium microadriaticum]
MGPGIANAKYRHRTESNHMSIGWLAPAHAGLELGGVWGWLRGMVKDAMGRVYIVLEKPDKAWCEAFVLK